MRKLRLARMGLASTHGADLAKQPSFVCTLLPGMGCLLLTLSPYLACTVGKPWTSGSLALCGGGGERGCFKMHLHVRSLPSWFLGLQALSQEGQEMPLRVFFFSISTISLNLSGSLRQMSSIPVYRGGKGSSKNPRE